MNDLIYISFYFVLEPAQTFLLGPMPRIAPVTPYMYSLNSINTRPSSHAFCSSYKQQRLVAEEPLPQIRALEGLNEASSPGTRQWD